MGAARPEGLKPLVSTGELAAQLASWRIFDCRHDLARPDWGEEEFRKAHLPGARFAHLDRDLSAPKTGKNGRHPLPDPANFSAWLGAHGLKRSDRVACYDAGNGTMAARLWWMLRWIGHDAVAVLDGGLARWVAEKRPLTPEIMEFPRSNFPARVRPGLEVKVDFVESNPGQDLLLDARAPARFRGEQEPIDPVAGRIPGAQNRFCTENLAADGSFKSSSVLRAEFLKLLGNTGPSHVIHYCGSGVAACHNLLAMEIAGLAGSRLYAGSWSEWIADPRRKLVRGG